jgi:hypothetical protein
MKGNHESIYSCLLLLVAGIAGDKVPNAKPIDRASPHSDLYGLDGRLSIEQVCRAVKAAFLGTGTDSQGRQHTFRAYRPTEHGYTVLLNVLANPTGEAVEDALLSAMDEAESFYQPQEAPTNPYLDAKPLPRTSPVY